MVAACRAAKVGRRGRRCVAIVVARIRRSRIRGDVCVIGSGYPDALKAYPGCHDQSWLFDMQSMLSFAALNLICRSEFSKL
jgi:hypothetical protein